jgi:hypothetical protein
MAVQRVRRVIRKIDPWTVLKVSMVFNVIMALVFVLGTVIFWAIFVNAGIPEKIKELALLIGLENGINLEGAFYFMIAVLLAVVWTIAMTGSSPGFGRLQPDQRPGRRRRGGRRGDHRPDRHPAGDVVRFAQDRTTAAQHPPRPEAEEAGRAGHTEARSRATAT